MAYVEHDQQRYQRKQNYPPADRNSSPYDSDRNGGAYGIMDDDRNRNNRSHGGSQLDNRSGYDSRNNQRYQQYPSYKNDDDSDLIKFDEPTPKYHGISDAGSCIGDNTKPSYTRQSSNHSNNRNSNRTLENTEKYGIESIMNRGVSSRSNDRHGVPNMYQNERRTSGDTSGYHQSQYYGSSNGGDDDSLVESVTPGKRPPYPPQRYKDQYRSNRSNSNEIRIDELSIYDDPSIPQMKPSFSRAPHPKPPSYAESSLSSNSLFDSSARSGLQQPSSKSLQSTATYSDYYSDTKSQYTSSRFSVSDNNASSKNLTLNKIIDDLPNGGEWYDTQCHAINLGVKLYAPEQLTQSLYEDVDYTTLKILKERPVIGYIFQNSPLQKSHTVVGDVLLAINDEEVTTPEDASQLIKESPRPIKLLFYTPDIKLSVNEGFHMVKYDSNSIDAPNSSKNWKPKYVVIGGLISKTPYILSMYRSKAEYDQAVRETFSRKPISVKIKQFSLMDASFESNSFQSVMYDKEPRPWLYFVLLPPKDAAKKGNAFQYPIKIASIHEPALVRIYKAIQRAILKVSNVDAYSGSGSTSYNMNSYDNASAYISSSNLSYSNYETASSYHGTTHDYLDDESSYYQQQRRGTEYPDSYYSDNGPARSVAQSSYYSGNRSYSNPPTRSMDSYYSVGNLGGVSDGSVTDLSSDYSRGRGNYRGRFK